MSKVSVAIGIILLIPVILVSLLGVFWYVVGSCLKHVGVSIISGANVIMDSAILVSGKIGKLVRGNKK